VVCWGSNTNGQLGINSAVATSFTPPFTPVKVQGASERAGLQLSGFSKCEYVMSLNSMMTQPIMTDGVSKRMGLIMMKVEMNVKYRD
jgi:hypothetical protein